MNRPSACPRLSDIDEMGNSESYGSGLSSRLLMVNFADPTLTVESLVGVMEKMTSDEERRRKVWKEVLEWNHVTPSSYFDEVCKKYTTAKEKTHALADVYVNSRPESSWQHLVQTLYAESELAAAKEAKKFLQQQNGRLRVKQCW
jgi:hypothetical protein